MKYLGLVCGFSHYWTSLLCGAMTLIFTNIWMTCLGLELNSSLARIKLLIITKTEGKDMI